MTFHLVVYSSLIGVWYENDNAFRAVSYKLGVSQISSNPVQEFWNREKERLK